MRICIVHPRRVDREVLRRALSFSLQADVTDFSCAEDVLGSSMNYHVFVVYSQLGHHMSGVRGVQEIRAKRPEAYIIGVSRTPNYDRYFLPAGADAFVLLAGNEIHELTRLIRNYCSRQISAHI